MAFKQDKSKNNKKGVATTARTVGVVVLFVSLFCLIFYEVFLNTPIYQNQSKQQQQIEQENTSEETTDNVSELTQEQQSTKIQETNDSNDFWNYLVNSNWLDSSTNSSCFFNKDKHYMKEEIVSSNSQKITSFVICKLKVDSNSIHENEMEKAFSATCMNDKNEIFDISLVVTSLRTGENEKISSMVLTSEGFNLGSYYIRVVAPEKFKVVGINDEKLQQLGVEKETFVKKLQEYCATYLPNVDQLDFSYAKINSFMNQNYVIFSVSQGSNSSKTLYVMYNLDSSEVQISETNSTNY